jgi:predicted transcriptional regulator
MTIRERIAKAFRAAKMSQHRAAEVSGISQATISRYLSGETDIASASADGLLRTLLAEATRRRAARARKRNQW